MEPILQINDLSVEFDTSIQRINAVDHVSLHVNLGEIVGIIGASGSGKSTLAKTILGLSAKNQSTKGQVHYTIAQATQNLLELPPSEWVQFRKHQATMVFQNPLLNLNPSLTIRAHFERVISNYDYFKGPEIIKGALSNMDLAHEMQNILAAYPHQLSGGQQQRVLIALAICQDVKLLLLDEPMSSLDKANQAGISKILQKLVNEKGISIIIISHDLNVIAELSDRIYVLHRGQVVENGSRESILNNPNHSYTQELVNARNLCRKGVSLAKNEVIINIKNLSHTYFKGRFFSWRQNKVTALNNINISIKKGSVIGLVGPSGSGKSTLVKVLLGIEKIQEGEMLWKGASFNNIVFGSMSSQIQIISQNTSDALNPRMLLDDQFKEVYRKSYASSDHYERVIKSLFKDVEMDDQLRFRYPSELSGGEVQRMALIRALILKPEVLILDESFSALDMLVQKRLVDLILDFNEKLGMTIVMISHDDRLVDGCCDEILELERGVLVSM